MTYCSVLYQILPFPRTKSLRFKVILNGYEGQNETNKKPWITERQKYSKRSLKNIILLCSLAWESQPFRPRGPFQSLQLHRSILPRCISHSNYKGPQYL